MPVGIHLGDSTAKNPAGHTLSTDFLGALTECDTLQCVHCGAHWEVRHGSRRLRSYCSKCKGHTCGKMECVLHCYPHEKRLDDKEKGRIIIP